MFIKLTDGSNAIPIQVIIEDKSPSWEEVKKAKSGYSFRITGKVVKSLGKGETIEISLKGEEESEKIQVFGRCDDEKYPLSGKKINV